MSRHARRLRLSCECGWNLGTVTRDSRGVMDVTPSSTTSLEVYNPQRGTRVTWGPDTSREARNLPLDLSRELDARTWSWRCNCGRTITATSDRLAALWRDADDEWERTFTASAWRRVLTA